MNNELREYEKLSEVGSKIYKNVNPAEILFNEKIFTIKKDNENYILSINMPFVDKNKLNLSQKGDEISISIKNEKRNFILPKKIQGKEIIGAKYENGNLNIRFNA